MKKQNAPEHRHSGGVSVPVIEPEAGYFSSLTHRHAREWATMTAHQAKIWLLLENGQLQEYDKLCSYNTGLVKEVAALRGQLQKLVQLAQQHEQEKANLGKCQALEKATFILELYEMRNSKRILTDFSVAIQPAPDTLQ